MFPLRPIFWCLAGCWFLAITAMPIPAPAAEHPSPSFRLAVTGETVGVFDQTGRLVQSLPIEGEAPDGHDTRHFAIVEDMDFDGHPDVRVLLSQGMVNCYYDCWLWRPRENAFVKKEEMRELSNPDFDQERKVVRIYERGSAVCHVSGELVWENGELVWNRRFEQDETDGGRGIVVRCRRRDDNGVLRLVGEEKYRTPPDGEMRMSNVCLPVELSGLNIVLDLDAEPLESALLPNGEWWLRQILPDGEPRVESRRLPALENTEDAVRRLILREWPRARDITVAPFPELAEKIARPAFRAEFLDGDNEDTQHYVAALIAAEQWSFWFVLEAYADAGPSSGDDGATHASAINARLKKEMEALLLRARIADPYDGGFWPGSGPGLYLKNDISPLDISVMDALILVKKTARAEHSRWIDRDRAAYRYAGPGTIGEKRALIFSFGPDDSDGFVPGRYFSVDEAGIVYEMDAPSGGEYWELDDANWWGEYGGGETTLRIQNYREGPEGMYFIFTFARGTETVFEGIATVRGRTARYGSLVFSLSRNDASVTMTADPDEAEGDGEEAEADRSLLEGEYARE